MKLRTKILGVLAGLAMCSAAYAQFVPGAAVLTTLAGTEYVQNVSATLSQVFSTSTLAGYVRSTGLLYASTATAGSAALTTEQTLGSYTLPANTLNTGTMLRIKASFSASANAEPKITKCYFGANSISSGTLTTNNKNGTCDLIVTKVGSSQQIIYGNMLVDTTPITGFVNAAATNTDTGGIVIKVTSQDASGGGDAVILNSLSVERLGN